MSSSDFDSAPLPLAGVRVTIVGELAGMGRRLARRLLASRGAKFVDEFDKHVTLVIVGEHDPPPADLGRRIDEISANPAAVRVVGETELWRRLGVVEARRQLQHLYTPAMLADLLGVPAATVRSWHRRGLIVPVREIHKLPYFDFHELQTARRLAQLSASGASPQAIERQLAELRRALPTVDRPLTQSSVVVEGSRLLLHQGNGLTEPGGQLCFDFRSVDDEAAVDEQVSPEKLADMSPLPSATDDLAPPKSPKSLREAAAICEETGRLREAADLYRAALASGGLDCKTCFQLADVLYRLGDSAAARERYFMAVELDEDFVEARAGLGCLLAEEGRFDLAVAAFQGALRYHDDYADVHYHLARALDEIGRGAEAERHWRTFLDLAPASPWAADAYRRLGTVAEPAAASYDE